MTPVRCNVSRVKTMLPGVRESLNRGSNIYDEIMEDLSFVQEALKRIHAHKGVRGSIIVNADGIPLRCRPSQMIINVAVQEL